MPKIGTSPSSSLDRCDRASVDRRIARAVRQEHPVRVERARTSAADVRAGTTSTVANAARCCTIERLMPKSKATMRNGPSPRMYGSRCRHRGHEVDAIGARLGGGGGFQSDLVGGAERPGHRAGVAQQSGEAAGVDAGDARVLRTA